VYSPGLLQESKRPLGLYRRITKARGALSKHSKQFASQLTNGAESAAGPFRLRYKRGGVISAHSICRGTSPAAGGLPCFALDSVISTTTFHGCLQVGFLQLSNLISAAEQLARLAHVCRRIICNPGFRILNLFWKPSSSSPVLVMAISKSGRIKILLAIDSVFFVIELVVGMSNISHT
jgi:hypothetical protein